MKRKLLALFMILVLTMTAFAGCGKDDEKKEEKADTSKSSFFKEMSECTELGHTGTGNVTFDVLVKSEDFASNEQVKDYLDESGNLAVNLSVDMTVESSKKMAFEISGKAGKIDGKLVTLALDGNMLYADISGLLDIVKTISGEDAASQIEQQIGKTVKLDINKVMEAYSAAMKESSQGSGAAKFNEIFSSIMQVEITEDQIVDFCKALIDALGKNFENITGTDDDMYTLTISNDNLGDVIDDAANFLKNDGETIVTKFADTFADLLEKAGVKADDIKADASKDIDEAVKSLQEQKDSIIENASKTKFNVVSKINVDEGKSVVFSIDTGDIEYNGTTVSLKANEEFEAGEASIADKIPADANDITTLITVYLKNFTKASEDSSLQ